MYVNVSFLHSVSVLWGEKKVVSPISHIRRYNDTKHQQRTEEYKIFMDYCMNT